MTDETLAEILSGQHDRATRADLRLAFEDLMDEADANGGQLDGPAFWGFGCTTPKMICRKCSAAWRRF